jgi:predicted nucleic acid-binding protein
MTRLALDTSAAVPLLLRSHPAHHAVRDHVRERELTLTGHSLAETYSVLTRLPGDARIAPVDAARLIDARFADTLVLRSSVAKALPRILSAKRISGGAVYDALVALAAHAANVPLLTRDRRALSTYAIVGATCELVAETTD